MTPKTNAIGDSVDSRGTLLDVGALSKENIEGHDGALLDRHAERIVSKLLASGAIGRLSASTRNRLIVAVAMQVRCSHCLRVFTNSARIAGLTTDEIVTNALGRSQDVRAEVAVELAIKIVASTTLFDPLALEDIASAGYSAEESIEIAILAGLVPIISNMARISAFYARRSSGHGPD